MKKKQELSSLPTVPAQALILFGKMLELARKERGWRQNQIAERVDVSRQTIARVENGDPKVAIGIYFTIAWILDVPVFPGIENTSRVSQVLTQFFKLLQENYPKRIVGKKEKKIENDF